MLRACPWLWECLECLGVLPASGAEVKEGGLEPVVHGSTGGQPGVPARTLRRSRPRCG